VNSIGLNIAVVVVSLWACAPRLSSAVRDRREQHERDCNELEGVPIDLDERDVLPLCVWQQSPPLPLIGQKLSLVASEDVIMQPDRQFNPPHQSKRKMAK
jgi:hypothetical protein